MFALSRRASVISSGVLTRTLDTGKLRVTSKTISPAICASKPRKERCPVASSRIHDILC